jgi:TonB-dependent starch-binding outer membrane protein SusC
MKNYILKKVCKYKLLNLFLFMNLFALATMAQVKISGKVTDAKGNGVGGVSVTIRNDNAGASTAADGTYQLTANLKAGKHTVLFTGVGLKSAEQTITVSANGEYTVNTQLQDDVLGLDAVIVTGTPVATSKRKLGNAISIVSSKDIANSGASSIDGALQGKIVGAQVNQNSGNPAGGISVTLRGVSTLGGSSEPLYLLDGVILNNDSRQLLDLGGGSQNRLVDLNPNDIDHIEVIKGAAAAAIYGSRANNGVVQIFTKRGKDGKASITFSTQLRSSSIRKKLEVNKVPFRFNSLSSLTDLTTIPVTRYDYQDDIFIKALGTENNLSVSGGNANTKIYASISNFYNQGIIDKTNFNRNGLRLNIDQKINNYISLTFGASFTNSTSKEIPNGGINSDYGALTGFIFANNYVNPAKDPVTGLYPSVTTNGLGVLRTNPLEAINRYDFKQRTNRFTGNAGVKIKPIKGLTIDYNFGLDNYTQLATGFIPLNNTTASFNTGFSRRADANVTQLNHDVSASYKTKILTWLESTTTVGGTLQYDRTATSALEATNLAPFGQTVNNGTVVGGESRAERSFWGGFIQQTFDLDGRLFLTAAARSDASSIFGKDNRNQFYPKVSGSYIISNEKFWQESAITKHISSMKLRAAWGRSGNLTGIGTFDRFTNYGPVQYNGTTGYLPSSQLGNENIKPEQQTELELGTDISLLNDRISIEFNYYKKSVKDLLLNVSLSPSSGSSRQYQNVGNLTNKGIEFLLRAVPIKSNKLTWLTSVSFSSNKNEVNGIEGGVLLSGDGFGLVGAVNGYAVGSFYTKFYARNPDGSLLLTAAGLPQREKGTQGLNGTYTVKRDATTGQPTGDLLNKVIGNPLPKKLLSFINEVTLNKFSFRMQWDGAFGFNVFNFTRRVGQRADYGGLKDYEKELRGEVVKGYSVAVFPIFEEFIEKGDYLKLRELSVNYNWKPKARWIQNVRFSLSGRNLLSIDNYSGYDPEINVAGQSNTTRGFDFVEVPLPRTIMFGVGVNF